MMPEIQRDYRPIDFPKIENAFLNLLLPAKAILELEIWVFRFS